MGTIKKQCVVRVRQPPQMIRPEPSAYVGDALLGHLPRPAVVR